MHRLFQSLIKLTFAVVAAQLFNFATPDSGSAAPIQVTSSRGLDDDFVLVQDGIPDYHPAPPTSYLDRNATAFFSRVPTNLVGAPTFEVRIIKLLERKSCFSDSSDMKHSDVQDSSSWFVEAAIVSRKNTNYSLPTIKLCPKANWLDKFQVGDTGIVVAGYIAGAPFNYAVPHVQTYREMIRTRREAGGWCLWTYCVGGSDGF